jgi:hypothetical protein
LTTKRSRSSMENDDYDIGIGLESGSDNEIDREEDEVEEEDGIDIEKETEGNLEFMISSRDNIYPYSSHRCNLMLGMIFGNFQGSIEQIGAMNQFTTQLRRDTARCIMTETICKKEVYTLDNRDGDGVVSRIDRHVMQDMQKLNLDHPLMKQMIGRVSQICLDHFWFVGLYWVDKAITKGFVTYSLPKMHQLLAPEGTIYFGMSIHIFSQLVQFENRITPIFEMSLVHADDVEEIDLVKGSHAIPEQMYSCTDIFGKKNRCPEHEFGFTKKEIHQTVSEDMGMMQVLLRFNELIAPGSDGRSYQFIKLTRISREIGNS